MQSSWRQFQSRVSRIKTRVKPLDRDLWLWILVTKFTEDLKGQMRGEREIRVAKQNFSTHVRTEST
jgi:hypothetical protein